MPYQCADSPEEWSCPVSVRPLHDQLSDQHGGDSLQALCLAIRLALDLLKDFRAKGGVLLIDGEDFPIEAYR